MLEKIYREISRNDTKKRILMYSIIIFFSILEIFVSKIIIYLLSSIFQIIFSIHLYYKLNHHENETTSFRYIYIIWIWTINIFLLDLDYTYENYQFNYSTKIIGSCSIIFFIFLKDTFKKFFNIILFFWISSLIIILLIVSRNASFVLITVFYCINYELTIRNLYSDIFFYNETTIKFEIKCFSHLFICTSNILYIDYFFLISIITNLIIVPFINRGKKKNRHNILPFSSNEKDNVMIIDLGNFTSDNSYKTSSSDISSILYDTPQYVELESNTRVINQTQTQTQTQTQFQTQIQKKSIEKGKEKKISNDVYKRKQISNNSSSKKRKNDKREKVTKKQPVPYVIGSLGRKRFDIRDNQ